MEGIHNQEKREIDSRLYTQHHQHGSPALIVSFQETIAAACGI
jgi:hypothetical protein